MVCNLILSVIDLKFQEALRKHGGLLLGGEHIIVLGNLLYHQRWGKKTVTVSGVSRFRMLTLMHRLKLKSS